MKQALFAKRVL